LPVRLTHALMPCIDAFARQVAAVDQHPRNRTVRVAVLVGVSQANHRSVGQFDAARTLDLEKKASTGSST
jgi:hypothetical protein